MTFLTIKEASEKWSISTRRITTLCVQGRIPGAIKAAGVWLLPIDSEKPSDARLKTGNYVGWRKKTSMSSVDYKSSVKSIKGTFAVEGMSVSRESIANLKRLANGESSCYELIEELKRKYMQEV